MTSGESIGPRLAGAIGFSRRGHLPPEMFAWLRTQLDRRAARQRRREATRAALRLRRLFDQSQDHVWRTLQHFGVPSSQLEDSFHRVFREAAARLDGLAPGSEQRLIYSITAGVARESVRSAASHAPSDVKSTRELAVHELVERRQFVEAFDRIVGGLTPELREVFVLYEVAGLSTADIAAVLVMTEDGVRARLRRARARVHHDIVTVTRTLSNSEFRRG